MTGKFRLVYFVDYHSGEELRFKPGGFGRHDGTGIGNVHEVLHGGGEHGESYRHLAAVHPVSQLL